MLKPSVIQRLTLGWISLVQISVLFVGLPTAIAIKNHWFSSFSEVFLWVSSYMLFVCVAIGFGIVCKAWMQYRTLRWLYVTCLCTYSLYVFILITYRASSKTSFDIFFLTDNLAAILPTITNSLAWYILTVGTIGLSIVAVCIFWLWNCAIIFVSQKSFPYSSVQIWLVFLSVLLAFFITPPVYGSLKHEINTISGAYTRRYQIQPYIPQWQVSDLSRTSDSVVILHLESFNGFVANNNVFINGERYSTPMPQIHKIAQDGIWLTNYVSPAVQTNRVIESLLCGISLNIGASFSYKTDQLPSNCLPSYLSRQNYQTIYLSAYSHSSFMNFGGFLSGLGFQDTHYADFMDASQDRLYEWGWDDCDFYNRSFDLLQKQYQSQGPKLVYFEVSSNHYPFKMYQEYADVHPFPKPKNFLELYANATSQQDACLATFYTRYNQQFPSNTHLFIFSDNGWPVGVNKNIFIGKNAYNDNFIVPFIYIPPQNKRDEYYVGRQDHKYYDHSDFTGTVVELLGGRISNANSFTHAFKIDQPSSAYEDCHVLVQPYTGGMIGVINKQQKYIYELESSLLSEYDLAVDPYELSPINKPEKISYQDFYDQYMCQRYKQ